MLWRCSEILFFFIFIVWSAVEQTNCASLSLFYLFVPSFIIPPLVFFLLSVPPLSPVHSLPFSSFLINSLGFSFRFFFFPFPFFPFRFVVNAMGKCKFLPWLPFHLPTCSTLCSGILHSLKILSHNPTPSSPLVAFIKLINNWFDWLMNSLMLQDTLGWFGISLGCR